MGGYNEGKHDDPADTQDRLVRVGTKYQATAPNVADGDNVYILVDSAGRIIVTGPVASDGVLAGNPILLGGSVDDTSPAAAAEGDVRVLRSSPEGNLLVEVMSGNSNAAVDTAGDAMSAQAGIATKAILMGHAPDGLRDRVRTLGDTAGAGLGVLAAAPWIPGASDVKAARKQTVSDSTTRVTVLSPTSGKKVRIIAVQAFTGSATGTQFEVYFATGTNVGTTAGKEIANFFLDVTDHPTQVISFPDGGGPVGAADDVVSIRNTADISTDGFFVIIYREE